MVKTPSVALVLALGFAGCNQVDRGDGSQPASLPAAQAEEREPASQSGLNDRAPGRGAVTLLRMPNGGIQPQAVTDAKGTLHLIYFKGDDADAGDLFYVRRESGKEHFSEPIRINSRARSACAVGSVRGGQIALGKGGRPHVVWNGDGGTDHTRLNDAGTAFEEPRNLMRETEVPDGGGTVAADDAGNVYVVWHGQRKGDQGEDKRKVWVARSTDEGKTFAIEAPAWTEPTGVCACCSTRALADRNGIVYVLYRSATAQVNRDTYLLVSEDRGQSFHKAFIHKWKVPG
jgi:hypothetical protein